MAVAMAVLFTGAACSDDRASGSDADEGATGSTATIAESSPGCDPARPAEPGISEETYDHSGFERTYLLSIPEGYDGTEPAPVIVNMHGARGTAELQNGTSDLPARAGERGYIVVSPNALSSTVSTGSQVIEGGIWNIAEGFTEPTTDTTGNTTTTIEAELAEGDDVGFINGLLDSLEETLCVDPAREYLTGKSNGAGMSIWLACQPGPRFAALAPVAGVNMTKFCPGTDVPPLVTFHGDADEPMPYAGGTVVDIELGVPSVDERLDEVAEASGCSSPTETPIGDDVIHRVWSCPDGGGLELYKVLGGGHTWPGQVPAPEGLGRVTSTIDATELMLDFFDSHTADR